MIIVTALLHIVMCCFVSNVLSTDVATKSSDVGEFLTQLPMFCHSVLHYVDFTSTALRMFDMKEFIKGNPQFPPSVTILTDLVTRIRKRVIEQTGETKKRVMQFDCLDVLKAYKLAGPELGTRFTQLKPYFDNRPQVSKVLSALATLVKDANSAALSSFTTICRERRVSTAEVKNQFLSIRNLAAAADFDLARLNLLILTMIGDFYRYQIVEGACGKTEAELAAIRNDWADIEVAYQGQTNYLLENWDQEKLNIDIAAKVEQSTAQPGSIGTIPWPDVTIQKLLEDKYYWNAFRVHVYPKEKVADVERFLCSNADTYPKTACVKGGDKIAIVHYQPLADVKLNDTKKILDRRAPPPEMLDVSVVLEPAAQATLNNLYPNETIIKGETIVKQSLKYARGAAKIFKDVSKFAVKVGRFLGPLAMGITGILGVLIDEGTPNVMEEMREGFKEMSNNFRELNSKLDSVKNEIINEVKSQAWMSSFHVSYFEYVKIPLSKLRTEFLAYDQAIPGPLERGKRKELYMFCDPFSYADNVKSPVGILHVMHKYFATTLTDGKSFPDAVRGWADAKSHRPTLQLLLAGFLMEVSDLQMMVHKCMPILVNGAPNRQRKKEIAATYAGKTALARRQAYEIKRVIFELNQAQLYGWMELIQQTFHAWNPPDGADMNVRAASLAERLQGTYDWNLFSVLVFKHSVTGSDSDAHVLHLDYTKILTRSEYTYVINWANRDEPVAKIDKFGHKFDFARCGPISTASALMNQAIKFGVPLGTKSVYIRKDIFEEGFYGVNEEKGNTLKSTGTNENLDFQEPQACCGTGGELGVSYTPRVCWIEKSETKTYCTTSQRLDKNMVTSEYTWLCPSDNIKEAKRWEKQKYAIAMNGGAGY